MNTVTGSDEQQQGSDPSNFEARSTSALPRLNLVEYQRLRDEVLRAIGTVAEVAEKADAREMSQGLRHVCAAFRSDDFKLVVVGEFSRGKSTAINAILGERVLPSSALPTTAVLTRIRYGPQARYQVIPNNDSAPREIGLEDFRRLVAPAEPDPDDKESCRRYAEQIKAVREVDHVDIEYPCEICRDGVVIIDTPGTNDLDVLRETITYDFIPAADAILFVLSARCPAAETEIEFLRDRVLAADIPRIFFLLNFADTIRNLDDRHRLFNHTAQELAKVIKEPKLFLVSARAALLNRSEQSTSISATATDESGYPAFEQALFKFLGSDRGGARLNKAIDRGLRASAELSRGPLALARRTSAASISETRAGVDRLKPQLSSVVQERDLALQALRARLSKRGLELAAEWRTGLEGLARIATQVISSYDGNLTREDFNHALELAVAPCQTILQERIKRREWEALREEADRAQRRLEAAWKSFYVELDAVFPPPPDTVSLMIPKIPDVGSGPTELGFITDEDLRQWNSANLVGKLGMAVLALVALPIMAIASLSDHLKRESFTTLRRAEVELRYRQTISGNISDWEKKWNEEVRVAVETIGSECNRKVADLQEQLDQAVRKHCRTKEAAESQMQELDQMQLTLSKACAALTQIKAEVAKES